MKYLLHAVLAVGALLAVPRLPAADLPNILFILTDDIGYGDLGCQGATLVKTPRIDRLAREGCRFTDAHSPAYSWRQQPGSAIAPGDAPASIPPGTVTVASLLKSAGYKTGVVGKWHLGLGPAPAGPDWNGDLKPGPLEIGFDYCFLMPATGDRVPCVYVENHRIVGLDPADPVRVNYKTPIGDDPTGGRRPDLLKLKFTQGHSNTIVNGVSRIGWMSGGRAARWKDEDMADTFARQAIRFIEERKDARWFLYLATHGIHVPRVPHPRFQGSSQAGRRGDAIQELDDTVGKVLDALDRLQLTGRTLVIFTSDNGGVNDDGYADFGPKEHALNGPWRGTKGTLFEGGHRIPLLARWPGHIKPGTENPALIAHLDFPATFAALVGVKLPAGAAPDSINVLPALLGESQTGRDQFIAHVGGTNGPLCIRQGAWTFIQPGRAGYGRAARGEATGPAPQGQLYNLTDDPAQQHNLVDEQPDKAKELAELIRTARAAARTRP
jgi:arylsulfatase A-like enzyme